MSSLKVCVDLDSIFTTSLLGLYNAYNERESNILNENNQRILGSDTLTEQLLIDAKKQRDFNKFHFAEKEIRNKLFELAMHKGKLWGNGKKLKIKFLGGTSFLHQKVINYARQWENFANIEFVFVETGDAEIRIAFIINKGSWSYVGTDALSIVDQSEPTMNFGWFDNTTTDYEFSRTVTHEFGHCLGCIHEHQSPAASINWNKNEVYDYYKNTQKPPWDKETVDRNIFEKFTSGKVTNSVFDPKSIMLYPIPPNFTTDGFSVGMNNILSFEDTRFIAQCYPKP